MNYWVANRKGYASIYFLLILPILCNINLVLQIRTLNLAYLENSNKEKHILKLYAIYKVKYNLQNYKSCSTNINECETFPKESYEIYRNHRIDYVYRHGQIQIRFLNRKFLIFIDEEKKIILDIE